MGPLSGKKKPYRRLTEGQPDPLPTLPPANPGWGGMGSNLRSPSGEQPGRHEALKTHHPARRCPPHGLALPGIFRHVCALPLLANPAARLSVNRIATGCPPGQGPSTSRRTFPTSATCWTRGTGSRGSLGHPTRDTLKLQEGAVRDLLAPSHAEVTPGCPWPPLVAPGHLCPPRTPLVI